jgi:hypothetical protein
VVAWREQIEWAHERRARHKKLTAEEDEDELRRLAEEVKREQDKQDARRRDAYEVRAPDGHAKSDPEEVGTEAVVSLVCREAGRSGSSTSSAWASAQRSGRTRSSRTWVSRPGCRVMFSSSL